MEGDAFGFHLRDAAVDQVLLHLEVGNAVAQQPAGLGVLLEDMNVVSGARQLLGGGQAGGAGADDGDRLPVFSPEISGLTQPSPRPCRRWRIRWS